MIDEIKKMVKEVVDGLDRDFKGLAWSELSPRNFILYKGLGMGYLQYLTEIEVTGNKLCLGEDLGPISVQYEEFSDKALKRIHLAVKRHWKKQQ